MPERKIEYTETTNSSRPAAMQDGIVRWPLYCGLIILVLFCAVVTWPIAEYAFSIVFVLWAVPSAIAVAILLILALWTAIRAAVYSRWRRAISALALPGLLLLALPLSFETDRIVNEMHFLVFRNQYLTTIASDKNTDAGRLVFFDWGGDAMIGFDRFLVFDESDEITLPLSQRSAAFEQKLKDHGFPGNQRFEHVQTVASHFYVTDFR